MDEPAAMEFADALVGQLDDAYRLAQWILRDPTDAEDAVQRAALLAWDRRSSLRDSGAFAGWFARIVVNVCRDELRRRPRSPLVAGLHLSVGGESMADLGARDELARAIARLDPKEQIVLALRYGRDLTIAEVAQLTDAAEGTVKSRLHAALRHLRAAIDAGARAEEVG